MNDEAALRVLRSPATIRERSRAVLEAVEAGDSEHFRIDRSRLAEVAERVAVLTRARFPDLARIPYHSRWRHFEAGGIDRKAQLDAALRDATATGIARARIDLTLVSVLLDAGAGAAWCFSEPDTGQRIARSEGLAVASLHAFMQGRFSSDAGDPLKVDAQALSRIDEAALAALFQAGPGNPLVGLDGRAQLLQRLGAALQAQTEVFGREGRPGGLFDHLTRGGAGVSASAILQTLLDTLAAIWPSGQSFDGTPVGDVWPHARAGGHGASAGLVPFHKLSQWLSYSLLEPFEWAGIEVTGLDALTGLPEYRNGGLLIDGGVIVPRDAAFAAVTRRPSDDWVVEWRALTVALLDDLAPQVRDRLGAPGLPLACILEGGTWAAGRQIALEKRPGGPPPVAIESDGTVF